MGLFYLEEYFGDISKCRSTPIDVFNRLCGGEGCIDIPSFCLRCRDAGKRLSTVIGVFSRLCNRESLSDDTRITRRQKTGFFFSLGNLGERCQGQKQDSTDEDEAFHHNGSILRPSTAFLKEEVHPSQIICKGRGDTLIVELLCKGHWQLIHELCHPDWLENVGLNLCQEHKQATNKGKK